MKVIKLTMYLLLLSILFFCSKESTIEAPNDLKNEIYSVMLDYKSKENFAGMGLLYYSDKLGKTSLAIGQSDFERNVGMDTNSVYDIGSTTKMFISILILQLIEEGKLTLDSSIDNWIDNIPNGAQITIGHLLNHTSGLNDNLSNTKFLDEYYSTNDHKYSIDDLINAGLVDTCNMVLGEWKYFNTNYLILGKIIETMTKYSVGQELKQRIFNQADMTDTYYMPECKIEQINNLATGYQFGNSMKLDKNYFLYNAAGEIVSTLSDMQKFAQWLLGSKYLDNMTSNSVDCLIENGLTTKYGQGILIANDIFSTTMFGHGGTTFGFKSEFWFSQETGEIIIYFVNDYMYKKNFGTFRKKINKILQAYRYD